MYFVSIYFPKNNESEAYYSYPIMFPNTAIKTLSEFFTKHMEKNADIINQYIESGAQLHNIGFMDIMNVEKPFSALIPCKICDFKDIFSF